MPALTAATAARGGMDAVRVWRTSRFRRGRHGPLLLGPHQRRMLRRYVALSWGLVGGAARPAWSRKRAYRAAHADGAKWSHLYTGGV